MDAEIRMGLQLGYLYFFSWKSHLSRVWSTCPELDQWDEVREETEQEEIMIKKWLKK